MIHEFMNECKGVDDSLPVEELKKKVCHLKEKILAHNNPYVKALLGVS